MENISLMPRLLILASLLLLQTGHTVPKALKGLKGTQNYLLTVDKTKTWNQEAVARGFGTDTILSYPYFRMTEAFGKQKELCRAKAEKRIRSEKEFTLFIVLNTPIPVYYQR